MILQQFYLKCLAHASYVVADEASGVAAVLGAHGAKAVLATGDLSGALPGPSVASALVNALGSEGAPDLFMFGTTYDGRDVAGRLSAKLDTPVITNIVDLEVDGATVAGIEPVFGGTINVKTKFAGDKPGIVLVRPAGLLISWSLRPAGDGTWTTAAQGLRMQGAEDDRAGDLRTRWTGRSR